MGPGRYKPEAAFNALRKKPCMAVLRPSLLLEEGAYEAVNHSRVLQPAFIRSKADRKALEARVKEYQETMRTTKRPNESVIYQKLLIERRSK